MGGLFKHIFGCSKIPLEDRVDRVEQMLQANSNMLLHEITNVAWLLLRLQNAVDMLVAKSDNGAGLTEQTPQARKEDESDKTVQVEELIENPIGGIAPLAVPVKPRMSNEKSGVRKENRDADVWLNTTTGYRANVTFRNGCAKKITQSGVLGLRLRNSRLYFYQPDENRVGCCAAIKPRNCNPYIENALFSYRRFGDLCPFAGAHDLKFDNERKLYYIERGA